VVATTLVMGTLGLSRGGFSVNHMDIAPKYAGIVMGVSNTAGAAAGGGGGGGRVAASIVAGWRRGAWLGVGCACCKRMLTHGGAA